MDTILKSPLKHFEVIVPLAAIILTLIGLSTIKSTIVAGSSSNPVLQADLINIQLMALAIGLLVFAVVSMINYEYFAYLSIPIYIVTIFLLALILAVGEVTRGSMRWLNIGPISFQPSSISIIFLIVFFGYYFSAIKNKINQLKYLGLSFVLMAIPMLLLLLEPDLGSALILFFVWFLMLHLTPISKKKLLTIYVIGILLIPVGITKLEGYQLQRLTSFVNPQSDPSGSGYNVIQSIIAVGSGQLFGRGWGRGTQSHLQYLPEQHTDFIFSTFAEEQGFIGALVLIGLYAIILWRLAVLAIRLQRNKFAFYIISGIITWLALHVFINIGMNIGIAPITGIPLLLVSYGGTAMITAWLAFGIVEAIYRHTTN